MTKTNEDIADSRAGAKAEFLLLFHEGLAPYSSVYLKHVEISLIMKTLHLNGQMFTLK